MLAEIYQKLDTLVTYIMETNIKNILLDMVTRNAVTI